MTRLRRRRLERAGVVVLGLLTAALVAWPTYIAVRDSNRADLAMQTRAALALQARTVESILGKYRHLPAQIAHRDDIRSQFDGSRTDGVEITSDIAGLSGASDVALLTPEGRIVADARERFAALGPSVVENIMRGPLEGRLGRSVIAPDEARRAPGYVFSYPVRAETGEIFGATAVLVDLARIEETWALSLDAIRAVDLRNRLIVGNDLGRATVEPVADTIQVARLLPQVGWRLEVARDARTADIAARNAAWSAATAILLLAGVALAWLWRRQAGRGRERSQRAASLVLEWRVRDRTRSLHAAQTELLQTAKLAALGRMSAALAHEYAQPLAAIRTYADNARTLVARGRSGEVPATLDRVTAMAERMRALSQTLRSFAREPGDAVRPTDLGEAFEDAALLAEADARGKGVTIERRGEPAALILGGRVRLSQVFLNLLTNAVAASPPGSRVLVEFDPGENAVIRISDEGDGVPADLRDQIFEPFFTTKPVGEGLGLGLAIAYNVVRDFGGRLTLLPGEGGAVFEVTLQRAVALAEAAE